MRTRNGITTPIHCMYISDTIWVHCIPMRTQNCINTVILFCILFTQSGYYSHTVGIFRLTAQPISGSLRLHDSAIHDVIVFNFFFWGGATPLPRPIDRGRF